LIQQSNKLKIKIKLIKANSYKNIKKILQSYSIFLSNPNNEPFGIATLEATHNKLYVLGKNEGGTSEIIYSGLNGILYPDNIFTAQKILKSIYKKNNLNYYKMVKLDWEYSASRILSIYHHFTHTPNE